MSNLKEKKFEDFYLVPSRNGLTRPKSVRGKGYSFINMGELFSYSRIHDIDTELVQLNDKEIKECTLRQGDLLFARQSLVYEGAGKCSIVMNLKKTTAFESHLIRVRLNQNIACPMFYYYYFNLTHSPIKSIVQQCAQAGIRGSDLSKLKVNVPDLATQQRIADILSAYDDLIENNNRRIELLEKAAQDLYKEWFVRFRFPGHENAKFKDGLPEGWSVGKLGDVATVIMGQSPKSEFYNDKNEGLPFHQGVSNFGNRFPTNSIFCTDLKRIATKGSILLSVRAPVGRINIASEKIVIGRGLCSIVHKENLNSFLFYQLNNFFAKEDIIGNGSIFNSVTKDELFSIKCTIPTKKTLLSFENIISKIDSKLFLLEKQNQNLKKQRNLLLPRLMSGKLEV